MRRDTNEKKKDTKEKKKDTTASSVSWPRAQITKKITGKGKGKTITKEAEALERWSVVDAAKKTRWFEHEVNEEADAEHRKLWIENNRGATPDSRLTEFYDKYYTWSPY